MDYECGFTVKVDISPFGVRHPHLFAKNARDDDPASRVAFDVTGTTNPGDKFTIHPQATIPNRNYL